MNISKSRIAGTLGILLLLVLLGLGYWLFRPLPIKPVPASFHPYDLTQGSYVEIEPPPEIFAIGLSYAKHIEETASEFDPDAIPPVFRKHLRAFVEDRCERRHAGYRCPLRRSRGTRNRTWEKPPRKSIPIYHLFWTTRVSWDSCFSRISIRRILVSTDTYPGSDSSSPTTFQPELWRSWARINKTAMTTGAHPKASRGSCLSGTRHGCRMNRRPTAFP